MNASRTQTGSTGARPQLTVPDPTPKIAAPAPTPLTELPEAALAPKNTTFEDLLDEDFSFLDPYLEGEAGTSVSGVVELQTPQVDQLDPSVAKERTVISRTERVTSETEKEAQKQGSRRAPTKEDQPIKRTRRESSSSESSSSSNSSDRNESSSESEGGRGQDDGKSEGRDEILTELKKTNQHLAMILTCLQEMNSNIREQGVKLGNLVDSSSKRTSSDHQLGRKTEEEKREEVEIREGERRKRDGKETVPDERKADDYRKRQRREGEDYGRGYHQWQPRRSPRKNKWFSWNR